MYSPIQPGIPKHLSAYIRYDEFLPTAPRSAAVACFWTLKTQQPLAQDFEYLVLPDGCIDIVFDTSAAPSFDGGLVMTPGIVAERLNLGTSFAYTGIRLQPGAWRGSPYDIVGVTHHINQLPGSDLREIRQRLAGQPSSNQLVTLELFTASLTRHDVIGDNIFMRQLLKRPSIPSVAAMAAAAGYDKRHLQRIVRSSTGYRPHDFIKIMRFQHSLRTKQRDTYSDQSHFTRECRRITGLSPRQLNTLYG